MTMTDIHSLFNIPHILHQIGSYVELWDIKQCQTVSQCWRKAFTVVYWRWAMLKIPAVDWEASDSNAALAERLTALKRIAPHVRLVSVELDPVRIQSLSVLAGLLPGTTRFSMSDRKGDLKLLESLVSILSSSFPLLKQLHVESAIDLKKFPSAFAGTAVARQLRVLTLMDRHPKQGSTLIFELLRCLPSLEELRVSVDWAWTANPDKALPSQETFALRKWQIISRASVLNPQLHFLSLWRLCPFIERYTLDWCDCNHLEAFATMFDERDAHGEPRRHAKALLLHTASLKDHQLVRVFRGCVPHTLTVLYMDASLLGPEVIQALLATQAASLQDIKMDGCVEPGVDPSPLIQKILTSCPSLFTLHTSKLSGNDLQIPEKTGVAHLRVDDIASKPWVCKHLKELVVPIVCVPSQRDLMGGYGLQESTLERAMKQLGRLVSLEHLDFARPVLANDGQPLDPLPLSLGPGGLQHLAALLKLRVLNVPRRKTQIDLAEIMWITKHLPNLGWIFGLEKSMEQEFISHRFYERYYKGLGSHM